MPAGDQPMWLPVGGSPAGPAPDEPARRGRGPGRWRRAGAALVGRAIGLIYPPACVTCGAATAGPHTLCAACWRSVRFVTRPYCERLGTPFALDLGPGLLSPAAIATPPVFRRARTVASYDGVARDLVHRLKYRDRQDLAPLLGRLMVQAGSELLADADVVLPIPLHRSRLWSRRFNQSAALARVIGAVAGKQVDVMTLRRRKRTRPQVGLSRAERAANLEGAFHVPRELRPRIEGRQVLLVDDVLTTGATANAAARVLLRAGAASVDVLTFAQVVPEG